MLRKLKAFLSELEQSGSLGVQKLQVAAAALLIELSKADCKRDPREQSAIVAAINRYYQIETSTVDELLAEAESASAKSTSLYEFTHVINSHCNEMEKFQLVRELWRVAIADGTIDKYEDTLIRKVADLIYLPHSQYIRAKLEALGKLNPEAG